TRVLVDDGEIVALGGLLDQSDRNTLSKVPLLGDIPIVGHLFRHRSRSRDKPNLMVFIRPTIVRSTADAQAMSAGRYGYMRGQLPVMGERENALGELVRAYRLTVPPSPPASDGAARWAHPCPRSATPSPRTRAWCCWAWTTPARVRAWACARMPILRRCWRRGAASASSSRSKCCRAPPSTAACPSSTPTPRSPAATTSTCPGTSTPWPATSPPPPTCSTRRTTRR